MNTSWGSEDDMEFDDELVFDVEHLVPHSRRNNGDIGIGTRDFYDELDRRSREIAERPR